jgi:FHA domain-containing protein
VTARCREGHESTELDYCSVCGAAMPKPGSAGLSPRPAGAGSGGSSGGGALQAATICPSCGETRSDLDARYCEVCRYDFVANKPGPPPVARSASSPTPVVRAAPSAPPLPVRPRPAVSLGAHPQPPGPAPGATVVRWELVVRVDPALDLEPDPTSPCPQGVPDEVIALDRDILVGRRDDRRDIRPELPLGDPGASRRHAKFVLDADGTPALQDLASTNGTKLNEVDTVPGSRTTLKEGDEVTLGRWTRIVLRARA